MPDGVLPVVGGAVGGEEEAEAVEVLAESPGPVPIKIFHHLSLHKFFVRYVPSRLKRFVKLIVLYLCLFYVVP